MCLGRGVQELPSWTLLSPQPLWESGQVLTPLKLPVPAHCKGDSSPSSGCSEEKVGMCEGVEQHEQWGPLGAHQASEGSQGHRPPTCLQDSQDLDGEKVDVVGR